MDEMRISQLAERTGVPVTTLRFYERSGLLPAGRTPSGYRVFDADAERRLAFIGTGKRLGLPLDEIGDLLGVWASGVCRDVKAGLGPRIAARLDAAERSRAELDAFTATLRAARDHLDALPDHAGPCGPECGLGVPDGGVVDDHGGVVVPQPEAWRTAPVACALTADGMADRVDRWRAALDGAVRTPIAEGVRLDLPAGRAADIAGLAVTEQACCPFIDIRLHLDQATLHLDVRAPEDAAELLAEVFGPLP